MSARVKKKNMNENSTAFKICSFVILAVYTLLIIGALAWTLMSSLKTQWDFTGSPVGFKVEDGWKLENFSKMFRILYTPVESANGGRRVYLQEMFLYSVVYTVSCVAASLFSHLATSYIAARFKNAVSRSLYAVVIIVISMPIVGSLPSEVQTARALGIYGNLWAVWILKGGFFSVYFLIFYASFKTVPKDFSDAAAIDGAGEFTIFFKIALPMIRNAIVAVGVLMAIAFWNDYQTPLIYLRTKPTASLGLYLFQYNYDAESTIPRQLAAALAVSLPTFALFMVFRNKIMNSVTMGGLKG